MKTHLFACVLGVSLLGGCGDTEDADSGSSIVGTVNSNTTANSNPNITQQKLGNYVVTMKWTCGSTGPASYPGTGLCLRSASYNMSCTGCGGNTTTVQEVWTITANSSGTLYISTPSTVQSPILNGNTTIYEAGLTFPTKISVSANTGITASATTSNGYGTCTYYTVGNECYRTASFGCYCSFSVAGTKQVN